MKSSKNIQKAEVTPCQQVVNSTQRPSGPPPRVQVLEGHPLTADSTAHVHRSWKVTHFPLLF